MGPSYTRPERFARAVRRAADVKKVPLNNNAIVASAVRLPVLSSERQAGHRRQEAQQDERATAEDNPRMAS